MTPRQILPILHYLCKVKADPPSPWVEDARLLEQYRHDGDETAFAQLVRRHGPRVLAVCRRVLGDQHDAEDAFQATFLLLARKAAGLRQPERLGPWLHGVAVRTALKARGRRRHLLPLRDDLAAVADEDLLWQDLRPVLDEAIASLPWRYRDPVILCYLEGASTSEAALQLGCPSGTIRSRLTRARALLRTRLVKRGVGVPARMLGGILPAALRDAVVPPLLLNSTCSIGVRVGAVSATVAALAKGVAMRMMLGKIQGTLMALVGVVGLGVGALAYRGTAQEKAEKQVESPAQVVPPTVASEGTAEKFEVRTTNFQVVASSKRVARLIGEAAERQRKDIAIKWLNEELPTWDKPCSITVEQMEHPHGGYSSFSFNDEGKLRKPSLMLWGTVEQLLSCELPHEVTHLVLADHFGRPIPRWANEGCAMLAEDDEQQAHYVKVMKQIQENSIGLAPLGKLLPKMDGYADLAIFNAQARSLTEFLIKKGEHRRFLAFVKSGMEKDWDSACQSVYGFKNVEELEVSWLRAIGNKELQAPVKGQATQSEQKGPAPRFVEALFVENQLLLYDANDYHEFATSLRLMEGKAVLVVSGWPRSGWNSVDPNPVRAFRADGKPLTSEQWQKALAKKQWILVAGDAEPVNPCYLKLLRDDTIVLILLNVRPDVTVKSVE